MFSNDLIIQILIYIENNLYKKISIDELSITFHYNKDYIMRLFKKEIGYTIIDYINHSEEMAEETLKKLKKLKK